jgi:hypothetical protein
MSPAGQREIGVRLGSPGIEFGRRGPRIPLEQCLTFEEGPGRLGVAACQIRKVRPGHGPHSEDSGTDFIGGQASQLFRMCGVAGHGE